MGNQLTSNAEALRLFFTEDIYLVPESNSIAKTEVPIAAVLTTADPNVVAIQRSKTEFKYLGKNQKNILILVNDQENEVSTQQGRELLRKLVKAIGLTANDFALVNYSAYTSDDYEALYTFFKCRLMIAFGVDTTMLNLPAQPMHQLVDYAEAKLLFAKNLHDLDVDPASKKVLWTSLQQLNL